MAISQIIHVYSRPAPSFATDYNKAIIVTPVESANAQIKYINLNVIDMYVKM